MSQKLLYLISFVLVLGMAGNALAVDTDWNNDVVDRDWDNPLNWSTGAVPTAADKASIRNATGDGPIISDGTTAVTDALPVGDWGNTNTLDITGGSLTTNNWIIIGYGDGDEGTFTVSGGSTTVSGGGTDLTVGRAGVGRLNISNGSITVGDRLYVGREASGTGYITMTGGLITINDDLYATETTGEATAHINMSGGLITIADDLRAYIGTVHINVSGGEISIGDRLYVGNGDGGEAHLTMTGGSITLGGLMAIGRAGASGEVHLDGGTLDIGEHLEMSGNASIDITGGTLIIEGDRISEGVDRSIMPYIDGGRITAYGVSDRLKVDYNITNPGKTTLTAVFDTTQASEPEPEDEETGVCRTVVLSWTPGEYAPETNGHKLYISADINDVNDRSIAPKTLTDPEYDTTGLDLEYGQTYYWCVDEVNTPDDKGEVWWFTVESFGVPIPNTSIIDAEADSALLGGPDKTHDLEEDLHSTDYEEMWLSLQAAGAWIEYEFDQVYQLHEMLVWNYNREDYTDYGPNNVTIEYSVDGIEPYDVLGTTHDFNEAPGTADYAANTTIDFEGVAAKYVRITVNSTFGGVEMAGLSEVRFFAIETAATEPSPDGENNVALDVTLSWKPGRGVVDHNVYISTDEQAVIDRSIPPAIIPDDGSCRASYGPLSLDLETTYYWTADEVNESVVPGEVWSFTTPDYLVVDNMESYGDGNTPGEPGNAIFFVWRDGWTLNEGDGYPAGFLSNNTGASIGNWDKPFAERTIVSGGSQSMPYLYDNDGEVLGGGTFPNPDNPLEHYSKAKAERKDLPSGIGPDWTLGGAAALRLYFRGDPNNIQEPMSVELTDSAGGKAVVTYGGDIDEDVNDMNEASWQPWNIALQDFNDGDTPVDLEDVNSIAIIIGDGDTAHTGNGFVYFDEIRLYPVTCVPSKRTEGFAELDYADNDCSINYGEIKVMTADWLLTDVNVEPVAPDSAGLIARYQFDGDNANDSAGDNHGTENGSPSYVGHPGYGRAIQLDGSTQYVSITGFDEIVGLSELSICMWVKTDVIDGQHMMWFTDETSGGDIYGKVRCRLQNGNWQFRHGQGASLNNLNVSSPATMGVWTHYAGVRKDNDYLALYIDGELMHKRDFAVAGAAASNSWIGSEEGTENYFDGQIDDVQVYNYALSYGEVRYVAGESTTIYLPLPSPANLSPKVGDEGVYNPDNVDVVNFKDYAELMQSWLEDQRFPFE